MPPFGVQGDTASAVSSSVSFLSIPSFHMSFSSAIPVPVCLLLASVPQLAGGFLPSASDDALLNMTYINSVSELQLGHNFPRNEEAFQLHGNA